MARAGTQVGTIQAGNLYGAVISAGKDIKKVNVKWRILDSYILAGYDVGADGAFGLQEPGGGDLPGSGNIGSVTAKGQFARSYVCAGVMPDSPLTDAVGMDLGLPYAGSYGTIGKVRLGWIDYDHAEQDFGLFAATEIKSVKINSAAARPAAHFVIDPAV